MILQYFEMNIEYMRILNSKTCHKSQLPGRKILNQK